MRQIILKELREQYRVALIGMLAFLLHKLALRMLSRPLAQLALHVPCSASKLGVGGKLTALAHPLNPNFSTVDAQVFDPAGHVLVRLSTVVGRY